MADPTQVKVRIEPPVNVVVSQANPVGVQVDTGDVYRVTVGVAERGAKGDTGPTGPQGPAGQNGTTYTLPPANATVLGGIKVGDNLTVTSNGVLSAQPGGVTGFNNRTGNIALSSSDVTTALGITPIPASCLTYSNITGNPPIASASTLGAIKVGNNLEIDANGVLSGTLGRYTSLVYSFNGRYGTVTQTSSDITNALGYTPPRLLSALSDVQLGSPAQGEIISYSQSLGKWVNTAPTVYSLPTANETVLGGIKVGGNLSISNGVLSAVGGTTSLPWSNITGTPTTLVGYGITDALTASNLTPYLLSATAASTYSAVGHTHSISNVTGLQTELDTKLAASNFTYSNLTGKPAFSTVATTGSYTDLSNTPIITNTFNGRSGDVTLTANDVTTLVNANYLQVYKDTQANESTLTQFGLSSFVQSGSLGSGYSRGLLTSNVSGATTRSVFDGNVYQSSATARYPAYKRIAFNSNNTSGANSTGRIQINDYGAVYIDSQTLTSGSNITKASAFSVGSATSYRASGDILQSGPGINFYAYRANNDGSSTGTEQGSFGVSEMQRGITGPNGTYISRPYTVSFESRNTWPVADTTVSYSYTPDYRTFMTIGDSAELFFQYWGNLTTRNPTWTSNSILTQGYADTRYILKGNSTSTVDNLFDTVGGLSFTLPSTLYGNATGGIGEAVNNSGGIGISARLNSDQQTAAMLTVEPSQIAFGVQGDGGGSLSYLVQSKNDFTFSQQFGTKLWTNTSILTRSYADTRYAAIGSSGGSGAIDGGTAFGSDNTFDGGSATG